MECDRVTRRCFDGCQTGWSDPTCNTSKISFLLSLKIIELLNKTTKVCAINFTKKNICAKYQMRLKKE